MSTDKPPEDCGNMKLYGDGKKFLTPVWYPCSQCAECKRIAKEDVK